MTSLWFFLILIFGFISFASFIKVLFKWGQDDDVKMHFCLFFKYEFEEKSIWFSLYSAPLAGTGGNEVSYYINVEQASWLAVQGLIISFVVAYFCLRHIVTFVILLLTSTSVFGSNR